MTRYAPFLRYRCCVGKDSHPPSPSRSAVPNLAGDWWECGARAPRSGSPGVRYRRELQGQVLLAKSGAVVPAVLGLPIAVAADNPTVPCPRAGGRAEQVRGPGDQTARCAAVLITMTAVAPAGAAGVKSPARARAAEGRATRKSGLCCHSGPSDRTYRR